ncbi:MAG TPA: DUF3108 domain-containing protein [Stellaceae bacterium]|nr:DUF3108 domain-containing protein [Stellaceae bacterium]
MLGQRGNCWWVALALPFLVGAGPAVVPPVAETAPLKLRYDVYARGFPVLSLDFRLAESATAYEVTGTVRAQGLLGALSDFTLHTESRGAVAGEKLRPSMHDNESRARRKERRAHLDFRRDGTVVAALTPADDPDHRLPTAEQVVGSVDPLTAILTIGHVVAQSGSCRAKVAVYDGRRRYDLVLTEDRPERAEHGSSAELRRCALDLVKLAGFTSDRNRPPRIEHGKVWIMPPLRPGMPPLPARIEFHSDWGQITVQAAPAAAAK